MKIMVQLHRQITIRAKNKIEARKKCALYIRRIGDAVGRGEIRVELREIPFISDQVSTLL